MKIFNFNSPSGELGIRFLLFRKSIKKSRLELSIETGIGVEALKAVEKGVAQPEIIFLHYLATTYDLNLNWLLCKEGKMFNRGWFPSSQSEEEEKNDAKDRALFQLLRIPVVEKAVLETLKVILERWIAED